jgi:hypothetical protein
MRPQLDTQTEIRALDSQRSWRAVQRLQRPPARMGARSYSAAVVRELPPRRELNAPPGTW